eukprot:133339-Rhodomonas_salina.1
MRYTFISLKNKKPDAGGMVQARFQKTISQRVPRSWPSSPKHGMRRQPIANWFAQNGAGSMGCREEFRGVELQLLGGGAVVV